MAIVPGFEYDIFLSYAHADDTATDGKAGWVAEFVRHLQQALCQRLGGTEVPKIFFDSRITGANYHLPELLVAAKQSALFLAVGSPSYVARDWPRQELEAFSGNIQDVTRLFLIECLPLNEREFYPPPLNNHIRLEFWKPTGRRLIPIPISPISDAQEFSTLVHSVASDIREKLLQMRYTAAVRTKVVPPSVERSQRSTVNAGIGTTPSYENTGESRVENKSEGKKKTVLIAQTTDDVADEADQILRYLKQFADEVDVLPSSGYPQGGEAFMAAFRSDLSRTDLFVQLLGWRIGRIPPDLPGGYTRFQLEAAKGAGIEIMQWRHPNLILDEVPDPSYKTMLGAETVVASGLEAFKNQVLTWTRKQKKEIRPAISALETPTVFINADDGDIPIAKEIERECLKHALTTFLPMGGPSAEANRKDLAENLTDCEVLLFIYGETTQDWIRSQLRFFGKVKPKRASAPRLLAICSGPPSEKPDIGVTIPNAHVINCPEGWDMDTIRDLLAGLTQ